MILGSKGKFYWIISILLIIVAIVTKTHIVDKQRPDARSFLQQHVTAPQFVLWRLCLCVILQLLGRNPIASSNTRSLLKDQRILITGGSRGIGYEITKGLVERGAKQVLVASRNPKTGSAAFETIVASNNNNNDIKNANNDRSSSSSSYQQDVRFLQVDLSDLDSVINLVEQIKKNLQLQPASTGAHHKLDQLILNAGIFPAKHGLSKQGHEIAYATNLLGPHLLLSKLLQDDLLKDNSKVIVTTGDLYVSLKGTTNQGCSSDFVYEGDGEIAYCRSKLGMMALFYQYIQRLNPKLNLLMVHPGVVDNGLVNDGQGIDGQLPKCLLLSNYEGAQTTLILASEEESTLIRGGYYHNVLGLVHLPDDDIAKNKTLGQEMWNLAENLIQDYR